MSLETTITNYITQKSLLTRQEKVLVALSGGVDSVVLLVLLKRLGFDISAAHCNFQLRGEESDLDEQFVQDLCQKLNIELFVKNFDTQLFADTTKQSIQMAARQLRYDWFSALLSANNIDKIATAHHLNDNIETVFLNLARGTGIEGLKGINPKTDTLIRPLLCVQKEEILDFAKTNNLTWREDKSNAESKYKRNFLRHQILPQFEVLNENFSERMHENIEKLAEANAVVNAVLKEKSAKINPQKIALNEIKQFSSPVLLLFEVLKSLNFSYSDCRDILNFGEHDSGKTMLSSTHLAVFGRGILEVQPHSSYEDWQISINENDTEIIFPFGQLSLSETTSLEELNKNTAYINKSKLCFPLILRPWQQGDKFKPFSMKGVKKVSDLLIDEKISVLEKKKVSVLVSGNEIVWVVGFRSSEDFKIPNNCKQILKIILNSK